MPDLCKMCINVMSTPWSRVRHWSAPERLQWSESETSDTSASTTTTTNDLRNSLGCSQSFGDLQNFLKMPSADKFQGPTDEDDDPFSLDPELFCSEDQDSFDRIKEVEMTSDQMEQSWLKLWSTSSDNDPPDSAILSADPLEASAANLSADSIQSNVTKRLDNEQIKSSVSSDNASLLVLQSQQVFSLLKPHPNATSCSVTRQFVVSGNVPEAEQVTEQDSSLILPNGVNMSVDLNVETSNRSRLSDWSFLSWISSFSPHFSPARVDKQLLLQQQHRIEEQSSCTSTTSTSPTTLTSPFQSTRQQQQPRCRTSCTKPNLFFWLLFSSVLLITSTPTSAKICPTAIIYDLSKTEKFLRNCTVIEGHVAFTNMLVTIAPKDFNATNLTFPELREITDFLLLYLGDQIKSLATLFPNLSVIRGNKLVKDYALIIREMKGMEEIGLSSLTHILRGGVKIEKNSDLCYVDTINWEAIVTKKYHSLISIEQNEFSNKNCMNKCPTICGDNYCWNEKSCQTVEVSCPHGSSGNLVCYRNGTSENGQLVFQCDKECLGGCDGATQDECFACANARLIGPGGGCRNQCPEPSLLYDNWRCITASECSNMSYFYNAETIDQKKSFKSYNGQCIEGCPEETKEKMNKDGIWICEKCENCPLECQGAVISSLEDLYRFKGCTIITGDLTIQVRGENVVEELQRHLYRVKIITGALKIARSFPIVSLDFFHNLEEIQGIHPQDSKENKKHYSITIMENENLQKLFSTRVNGRNVKIRTRNGPEGVPNPGRAFIHYNPKLCAQEIKDLLKNSGLDDPGINSAEISYATNGDKAVCSQSKLNLTVSFEQDKTIFSPNIPRPSEKFRELAMTVQFNNYQEEITKNPTNNYRALLGYEIHYRVIDQATFVARNLTKYGGRDACGGDDWQVIDHPPTDQDRDKDTYKPVWPREFEFIMVRPYTYYAIFVTTLIVKEVAGSSGIDGAQSDIVYILSPEDYPSSPLDLDLNKFNYSTINLTWSPPQAPNGVIDHYDLVMELKEVNLEKLRDINYCDSDYRKRQTLIAPQPEKPEKPPAANTSTIDCPCDCRACGKPTKKSDLTAIERKFIDEVLVDEIIDTIFPHIPNKGLDQQRSKRSVTISRGYLTDQSQRSKRSVAGARDNSNDVEKHDEKNSNGIVEILDDEIRYNVTVPSTAPLKRPYSKKRIGVENRDDVFVLYSAEIPGTIEHAVVTDLQHDSTYVIRLRACHRPNQNGLARCSEHTVKEVKTPVKPKADNIPGELQAHHDSNVNAQQNNESLPTAYISWEPPKNPNTMIVSYNVRITKVDDEKFAVINCITAKEFEENKFKYNMRLTGTYSVEVQAIPLYAEPGQWTKPVKISVAVDEQTQFLLALLIPISLIVLAGGSCFLFFWIRARKEPPPLIPNENYHLVENLFSRDEYWIERDNVELGELIGSGAFGEVHSGTYHHPTQGTVKVAIKMLRETANWIDRKLFLEEATIMKNLRSAHIVELIGAVPNGFPIYILLEMMPNGDLKKYLRDSRPLSLNRQAVRPPPLEKELLQMAIEIADGMAYLSSRPRSIVHRDLAARNCLLTAENIVKVGDFGRARDVYESEYYRQTFRGMVPVRWMPPESLRDGEYVTKSDVWSYGVVMWEMATLAEEPYQGMRHDEVVRFIIDEGGKPEIRPSFPEKMKEVMEMCWKRYPDDRPSFLDICKTLESYANERFRATSFVCSQEGQDFINASNEEGEVSERAPLRESSSSGCGNGNTGNSNGDARSASTTDNGHAVMAASAALELGSIPSHAGEVRQLGPSGSVSFRTPGTSTTSSNLTNLRNLWLRIRNGGRVLRGPQEAEA